MLRATFVGCLLVCLATLGWFVATHSYSLYDDAYIYFRYVENFGCGLRWNCGQPRVEGFTSPIWLLLLVVSRLFTHDLETASQLLGAAALLGAMAITVKSALRFRGGPPLAIAVTLALACDSRLLLNSVSGLETSLACLAVALIFHAALEDRPPIFWCLFGILVRPELAVFLPALGVWPRRMRSFAIVIVAVGAMTALRWLIFRDVLPNTFWAKSGGTRQHFLLGLTYLWEVVRDFPLILFAPLALRESRRIGGFFLIAAGLAFAFFLHSGGDTFSYSRLAVPFVPTLTLLAVVGLGRLAAPIVAVAFALFAIATHTIPTQHGFENVLRWKRVGLWLRETHPGTPIATVPIGAIGYFSQAPLYDLVGLTQKEVARGGRVPPEMLTRTWIGHERSNPEWILAQKPELLVFTKWRERPWTLEEARAGFWAEWQLLDAIKHGAPYGIEPAEILPGVHWLVFRYNGTR